MQSSSSPPSGRGTAHTIEFKQYNAARLASGIRSREDQTAELYRQAASKDVSSSVSHPQLDVDNRMDVKLLGQLHQRAVPLDRWDRHLLEGRYTNRPRKAAPDTAGCTLRISPSRLFQGRPMAA